VLIDGPARRGVLDAVMPTPTPPTNDDLLAAGRIAMQTALLTGQSVSFNGRTWSSHDLDDLAKFLNGLEIRLGGTSPITRVAAYCSGL
jgi:hypothetical protein